MDYVVNMGDFAINAAHILVAVNSKTFTIRSQYYDAALYLYYAPQ